MIPHIFHLILGFFRVNVRNSSNQKHLKPPVLPSPQGVPQSSTARPKRCDVKGGKRVLCLGSQLVIPPEKGIWSTRDTLPETNIAHENPIFSGKYGKYHQNGGFSMAMLVYRRVVPWVF